MAEALGLVAKPVKREKIAAVIRKDAIRERLWFGPFTLPPLNVSNSPLGYGEYLNSNLRLKRPQRKLLQQKCQCR